MSTMRQLTDEMRAAGIKKIRFQESEPGQDQVIIEVELSDTIPAPPSFDEPEQPEEEKPPGVCRYKGCGDAANSPIVAGYCRSHALKLAGVGNG